MNIIIKSDNEKKFLIAYRNMSEPNKQKLWRILLKKMNKDEIGQQDNIAASNDNSSEQNDKKLN